MRIQFLFLVSSISALIVAMSSRAELGAHSKLQLRQRILLLENNALRNILNEKDFVKRSEILEAALIEIGKIRDASPQQIKKEEKAIAGIIKNLKSMSSQKHALYKGTP